MKRSASALIGIAFSVLLLLRPAQVIASAASAVSLYLTTVVPTLLPAFVGARLLMQGTAHRGFAKTRLVAIGTLCGTPTSTLMLADAAPRRLWAAAVCFSGLSPAFLLGAMPGLLGISGSGVVFLLCQALACWLIGGVIFITSKMSRIETKKVTCQQVHTFGKIVEQGLVALGIGFGCSVVCAGVIGGLSSLGMLSPVIGLVGKMLAWIGLPSQLARGVVVGIFDLPEGCRLLAEAQTTVGSRIVAMSAIAGFGSIPILLQQTVILGPLGLKSGRFFAAKAACGLLAGGLGWLMAANLSIPVGGLAQAIFSPLAYSTAVSAGLWLLHATGKQKRPA